MIRIVPATFEHAEILAPNLRKQDKDEVMASGGYDPLGALALSVSVSTMAWTAFEDLMPFVMFGAAAHRDDPELGVVWLLGSDHIYNVKKTFLVQSRNYVSRMHDSFDTLANYVDARNTTSQKWLEALGFQALEVNEHYGYERRPFILYASYS